MKNKIKFTVFVIFFSIFYLSFGMLFAYGSCEFVNLIKVEPEVVEQVVEDNSEMIISLLEDDKLKNCDITFYCDDEIEIEVNKNEYIRAVGYHYIISYVFDSGKLCVDNINKSLIHEFPIFFIIIIVIGVILYFLLYLISVYDMYKKYLKKHNVKKTENAHKKDTV